MSATTTTATTSRKTSADYARASREKMREALAMAKKADALMREAARNELRAAELKAKEKAAALAAKEKAKTAKTIGKLTSPIAIDGKGRTIPVSPAVRTVLRAYCGGKRHGSFLLSSVEADDIIETLGENVSLTHGSITVQFPGAKNAVMLTPERDELLTWNTVPREMLSLKLKSA